MDFDDDSDCPSEECLMGLMDRDNEDADQEEEQGNGGTDSDDDGDITPTVEWTVLPAKALAENIKIDFGRNDQLMFSELKEQAEHVLVQLDSQLSVQSNNEVYATEAVQLTNCFLPSTMWLELQAIMNKRLGANVPAVELREIELLFRFLFALGSYRGTLSTVLKGGNYYPGCQGVVKMLHGGADRLHQLIHAMDPAPDKNESQWHQPFKKSQDLHRIEKLICDSCSRMTWVSGFDLCIDDDKVCCQLSSDF